MIDILDDTDNIDPSLFCDLCPWLTVSVSQVASCNRMVTQVLEVHKHVIPIYSWRSLDAGLR